MREDCSKRIEDLIKLKQYGAAYNLINIEIKACLKEKRDLRNEISNIVDYELNDLNKKGIDILDAYIYRYNRQMEQVLYYQLKDASAYYDEFILKLEELKPLILDQPENNDYWLFWHLPNVIVKSINNISEEEKVYSLFKKIESIPFLKDQKTHHESFMNMVSTFLIALTNKDYKKEIIDWSGIDSIEL